MTNNVLFVELTITFSIRCGYFANFVSTLTESGREEVRVRDKSTAGRVSEIFLMFSFQTFISSYHGWLIQ